MITAIVGSKRLSVDILNALLERGHEVAFVISRDSEPSMRLWIEELGHPALSESAAKHGIPVYDGLSVRSEACLELVASCKPDVIFSCFWGEIFREPLLSLPRLGILNFHTALLPKNRGSRAIPWAIINGESHTGITIHRMDSGVDSGPIIAQKPVPISRTDTAKSLYEKVCVAGALLFREIIPLIERGAYTLKPQISSEATYHLRGEPFGGQIDPQWTDGQKNRFIRAMNFPPFRAHRKAPDVAINGKEPAVYIVQNFLDLIEMQWDPAWTMFVGRPHSANGGERKKIMDWFPNAPGQAKPIRITGSTTGLRGCYAVLDVMAQNGFEAVSSVESKNEILQPFRYENGILEIPSIVLNKPDELRHWIAKAKEMLNVQERDVFLVFSGAAASTKGWSQEIKKTDSQMITFAQVCDHYNTPYEHNSA